MIKLKDLIFESDIDTSNYSELSDKEKEKILWKLYPLVGDEINKVPSMISNSDRDTIAAAKKIAKQYKIPYQDLLAMRRPSGSLRQPVWDQSGKVVPWEKVFGRR